MSGRKMSVGTLKAKRPSKQFSLVISSSGVGSVAAQQ